MLKLGNRSRDPWRKDNLVGSKEVLDPMTEISGEDFATAKKRLVERFEREILRTALREHGGNVSSAARELGLHRQSLQQKLRRLGIDASEFSVS